MYARLSPHEAPQPQELLLNVWSKVPSDTPNHWIIRHGHVNIAQELDWRRDEPCRVDGLEVEADRRRNVDEEEYDVDEVQFPVRAARYFVVREPFT